MKAASKEVAYIVEYYLAQIGVFAAQLTDAWTDGYTKFGTVRRFWTGWVQGPVQIPKQEAIMFCALSTLIIINSKFTYPRP